MTDGGGGGGGWWRPDLWAGGGILSSVVWAGNEGESRCCGWCGWYGESPRDPNGLEAIGLGLPRGFLMLKSRVTPSGSFLSLLSLRSRCTCWTWHKRIHLTTCTFSSWSTGSNSQTGKTGSYSPILMRVTFHSFICTYMSTNQLDRKNTKITETQCFTYSTLFPDNHKFPSLRAQYKCIRIFLLFYVWVSVHHKSILYKEPTRCNFGSIVY